MARNLCILASSLLLIALVLSFFVSLSLPFLPSLDIIRISNPNLGPASGIQIAETRMGIWTFCVYLTGGPHICPQKKLGYVLEVVDLFNPENHVVSKSSWTGALVVHTIATGFIFIAFATSLVESLTINFVAFVASSFAALITLIAFVIDIIFFARVHNLVKNLDKDSVLGSSTKTGPGFWLSFFSFVLVLLASLTFCFGQRREPRSSQSTAYPMQTSKNRKLWDKFEFNGN